jgi:alkanesulfonate monooxygenase SsuD/methylene tetrahydromethanopterin reductase-like flavin-dependent oxidoreductase (luciferase family)
MLKDLRYSISLNNRLAAVFPEYGFSGMLKLAHMADESPLEAVWVGDSLFDSPRFEPITTLAAVAASTKRIRLGTSILQPHLRNPILLAGSWATLDHASHGRTILGIGIGGGTPDGVARECSEVGITPGQRGRRLESTLEDVRNLWAGRHPRVQLPVRPLQERVPVWIAAGIYLPGAEKASAQPGIAADGAPHYIPGPLERVARLADGWITIMATPSEIKQSLGVIHAAALRHQSLRTEPIVPAIECWISIGDDSQRCFDKLTQTIRTYFSGAAVSQETVKRWSIWGSIEACRERLHEYEEAGVRHVKFVIAAGDPASQWDVLMRTVTPGGA